MQRHRVYADFQKLDDLGRLVLLTRGSLRDLSTIEAKLHDGLEVTFYSDDIDDRGQPDDLEADGTVWFDADRQRWLGIYDEHGFRHASDGGTI